MPQPLTSGSLPPIGEPPAHAPRQRTQEEQAALEKELQELHDSLGVKRGEALKEALRPEFVVPSPPLQMASHPPPAAPSDTQRPS